MKNKKILSRILALCSVVVLLFALAIPCFADETSQVPTNAELWELFAQQDDDNNGNVAYKELRAVGFDDHDIYSVGTIYTFSQNVSYLDYFFTYGYWGNILNEQNQGALDIPLAYGAVTLTMGGSNEPDLIYYINRLSINYLSGAELTIYGYDSDGIVFNLSYRGDDYAFNELSLGINDDYDYMVSDGQNQDMLDVALMIGYWDLYGASDYVRAITDDAYSISYPAGFAYGYTSGYTANRPDGVVPPAKTGLFGQLYYILSDAIYGENVVLGSTQDFALTLVTTLLVLCVVLLPVLLVVAIMFKLFR